MKLAYRDGGRMCVLRPSSREAARQSAIDAKDAAALAMVSASAATALFASIPSKVGSYHFVGYLAHNRPLILDEKGGRVGRPEDGDVLICEKDLERDVERGAVRVERKERRR